MNFNVMKKKQLLSLVLLINFIVNSQDLNKVDKIIRSYKDPVSIKSLSERIDYDFKKPMEKVRAVYTWIATNIRYHEYSSNLIEGERSIVYFNDEDLKRRKRIEQRKKAKKTFNKREAVCEGYSYLFKKICDNLKIENELVFGYTKYSANTIGYLATTKNHVWNVVKINGEWIMLDVTFSAGESYSGVWKRKFNPSFFNLKKEILRTSHFPEKKKWKEFLNQQELKEFCEAPLIKKTFFKHDIDIIEPLNGTIIADKKKKILFKVDGLEKDKTIKYMFWSDNKVRVARVKNRDLIKEFYLQNPKENTILSIYIENELALEYKIKLSY